MTAQSYDDLARKIVDTSYDLLVHNALVPETGCGFAVSRFREAQARIEPNFQVPQTTVSPIMRRFLFHIANRMQPDMIYGAGTYVGFALAWLVAGRKAQPGFFRADGVDCDAAATVIARRNMAFIADGDEISLRAEDALQDITRSDTPIDMLFIDIDTPDSRKSLYLDILLAAEPRLLPGALVLAHDPLVPLFADDLAPFFKHMNDSNRYRDTIILPLDECGLSISTLA
jgi:predicted O-methyltransferase YrrM